jgi:energy-coupling factor transport system ATP-binding protein
MNQEQRAILAFDKLTYNVPASDGWKTILQDIELKLFEREWLAIVGSNGSGKSTLAKLIARLYQAPAGTVIYPSGDKPSVQLVMQNPDTQVIGETVFEDVCIGMMNKGLDTNFIKKRALEALSKVGLSALRDAAVIRLSGGQKQLLSIAGCIAVKPSILVFDEATSMLDPMSRGRILQIAQELHREGTTIVWITQILDELSCCDRVAAMSNGRLVFTGTKRDFFYNREDFSSPSICEQLGFIPPYTIQVVHSLLKKGCKLDGLPLTPAELGKAVGDL